VIYCLKNYTNHQSSKPKDQRGYDECSDEPEKISQPYLTNSVAEWNISDIDLKSYHPNRSRKQVLERNRISALKYRRRKRQEIDNLDAKVQKLEKEKFQLQVLVDSLMREIQLRNENFDNHMITHHGCRSKSVTAVPDQQKVVGIFVKQQSGEVSFMCVNQSVLDAIKIKNDKHNI